MSTDTSTPDTCNPLNAHGDQRVLLRPEEAADRLGISRAHVYRLIGSRALRSVLVGRSRRVPVDALAEFVAQLSD